MVVARSADGGATWVKQGIIKNAWAHGDPRGQELLRHRQHPASPFYGRHYTCWDRDNNEKFAYSSNNGVTWTEVDLPTAPFGGIDLACEIAVQKNGTVHVVFDSLTCTRHLLRRAACVYTRSTDGGVSWSAPVQVRDFNLVGFSGANTAAGRRRPRHQPLRRDRRRQLRRRLRRHPLRHVQRLDLGRTPPRPTSGSAARPTTAPPGRRRSRSTTTGSRAAPSSIPSCRWTSPTAASWWSGTTPATTPTTARWTSTPPARPTAA